MLLLLEESKQFVLHISGMEYPAGDCFQSLVALWPISRLTVSSAEKLIMDFDDFVVITTVLVKTVAQ